MEDLPEEINLVTLNCWGLKYISKLRRERLSEIGRQLAIADPKPHIVALQECWTQEDYKSIRRQTRFILPYAKFYHSAALGGGLAILSRWPIEESTMYRYPLNGRPTAFWRGDWYVGKGVACAKIRYGPAAKQVIEVFNTHTHAPYEGGKPNDSYLCHRTAQSWEIAKLLRGAAERGHLVIAMGDFNMIPMSLEHQLVTALAPVRDTWRVIHPDSSVGPADHPAEMARRRPVPTAEFNIQENGAASDGPYNTWRWTKAQQKLLGPGKPPVPVAPDTPDRRGKRLDYIFAGSGDIHALGGGWVVKRVRVGMMMRHPEFGCSLSDHFAIESTLAFHPLRETQPSPPPPPLAAKPASDATASNRDSSPTAATATVLPSDEPRPPTPAEPKAESALHNGAYLQLQSPTPSSDHDPDNPGTGPIPAASQIRSFLNPSPDALSPTAYDEILSLIRSYTARERAQLTWRAAHFFLAVLVTVACLVGVWFSPHNYVSFILVLVSSLGLTAGTVDGLLALLFFRSELKALKEFEWEVRNAKGALVRGGAAGWDGGW
ncbi:f056e23d-6343-4c7b-ba98-35a98eb108b9 [Thermothielavioides terrestris]|uniref:F056e23d-6343-4c7b-ba98-35a98eb108b9 n=1 Tax=Thermothielavioides terrestris TaxID=2587410 RepID=A0A446B5U4_9PEZI|nr:f056e23d-6343-4c7b-ba98-35a98eb108b9 [Thermothielavioides terrestris]